MLIAYPIWNATAERPLNEKLRYGLLQKSGVKIRPGQKGIFDDCARRRLRCRPGVMGLGARSRPRRQGGKRHQQTHLGPPPTTPPSAPGAIQADTGNGF